MNRLHAITRVLLVGFFSALVLLPAAYAQPDAISFQGLLTNADGTPVSDGTYPIAFALYDSETGATPLETMTDLVSTKGGVFVVDWINIVYRARPEAKTAVTFIEVTIDGETLSPRTPVTAVPFALQAQHLGPEALEAGANVTIERQDDGALMISATGGGTGGLASVASDATLTGDGTSANPLGLADGSVTGRHIAGGTIVGGDGIQVIPPSTESGITEHFFTVEISEGGVTRDKLADGSVTGAKIADGAIVGDGNILVSRQNDGSVMFSAGDVLILVEADDSLDGDGTPENPLGLADGGVTSEKLADNSVTEDKIAVGSVTGLKLADQAVTEEKLDDEAVTKDKIADGAVAAAKLDGGVIEAGDGIEVTRTGKGSFKIAVARSAAFRVNQSLDAENVGHRVVASLEPTAVYNGNVVLDARGEAVVVLPDGFAARTDEVRYQLTPIGGFAPVYVAEEIAANRFSIAGGTPGMKVSWQVTGVRLDP